MNYRKIKKQRVDKLFEELHRGGSICDGCAYENSAFCVICVDGDQFKTPEEKEVSDWLCDLMCGCPESEEE